jgi:hypothetical protein
MRVFQRQKILISIVSLFVSSAAIAADQVIAQNDATAAAKAAAAVTAAAQAASPVADATIEVAPTASADVTFGKVINEQDASLDMSATKTSSDCTVLEDRGFLFINTSYTTDADDVKRHVEVVSNGEEIQTNIEALEHGELGFVKTDDAKCDINIKKSDDEKTMSGRLTCELQASRVYDNVFHAFPSLKNFKSTFTIDLKDCPVTIK